MYSNGKNYRVSSYDAFKQTSMNIPKNIILADPQFNVPSTVQLLLGADVFWRVLCIGQIKSSVNNPTIQKTLFGWILAGSINNRYLKSSAMTLVNTCSVIPDISNSDLEQSITKFWDFEHNISSQNVWSPSDHECEEHFLRTIKQNSEGRFIVTLPIKTAQSPQLGESKNIAL